eukprot:TRINITY_DN5552_c0_g1_i12.p4 TRINITY_DN5552_c0_g1~~TRINITY_DN5552_c0_g1_i12.p4  ORF type:complete len:160 (+),score=1.15 TRINITY_DN5552_c0_g1_i12:1262-1741(+)
MKTGFPRHILHSSYNQEIINQQFPVPPLPQYYKYPNFLWQHNAQIITPQVTPTQPICLIFFYMLKSKYKKKSLLIDLKKVKALKTKSQTQKIHSKKEGFVKKKYDDQNIPSLETHQYLPSTSTTIKMKVKKAVIVSDFNRKYRMPGTANQIYLFINSTM